MMKYIKKGIKLGITVTGGLITIILITFLLLKGYAIHEDKNGCWNIEVPGTIIIDAGSEPTCAKQKISN